MPHHWPWSIIDSWMLSKYKRTHCPIWFCQGRRHGPWRPTVIWHTCRNVWKLAKSTWATHRRCARFSHVPCTIIPYRHFLDCRIYREGLLDGKIHTGKPSNNWCGYELTASKISEFIEFEDRLDNSLQRDFMKIEHVRMRLTHEPIVSDLVDMELIELKFIFDRCKCTSCQYGYLFS